MASDQKTPVSQSVNDPQEYVFLLNKPLDKSVLDVEKAPVVRGYDFQNDFQTKGKIDLEGVLLSYIHTGFQATSFGRAIEEIKRMIEWRLSDDPIDPKRDFGEYLDPKFRESVRCKIFLGYTSNMISSGVREVLRFLVQNRMVDVIVSTAGGIEEDFIKCMANTLVGEFELSGRDLRLSGFNRIGNMVVPNENYVKFEEWILPILDAMLDEQQKLGTVWTPSKMIHRLGKEINNEDSVYYWCWKNNIPVYSPAITDGSIGDMIYFHSYKRPGLILDLVQDIRAMNNEAVYARKTGMIILGGGLVKHHICNANLFRNGADFAVFINTGQEFDGSDSGAKPDEAKSWGKIRIDAKPVKLYAEATLVFPLLVAQTFGKYWKPKSD